MTSAFGESLIDLPFPQYEAYTLLVERIKRCLDDGLGGFVEDDQARGSPSNNVSQAES
jgi:hypothetical protein